MGSPESMWLGQGSSRPPRLMQASQVLGSGPGVLQRLRCMAYAQHAIVTVGQACSLGQGLITPSGAQCTGSPCWQA